MSFPAGAEKYQVFNETEVHPSSLATYWSKIRLLERHKITVVPLLILMGSGGQEEVEGQSRIEIDEDTNNCLKHLKLVLVFFVYCNICQQEEKKQDQRICKE